jgi:cytochrome c oxidase assembly factor CtaG
VIGTDPLAWQPHAVLWAVLAVLSAAVVLGHRRLQRGDAGREVWPRADMVRFAGAVVVTGIALGWPLGDLAAHWSLSALVVQRVLLVLAVAPLLLRGLPHDLLRWLTRPAPVDATLTRLARPPAAVAFVTVVLVGSMLPAAVSLQARSAVGRGLLAAAVIVAGLVLWIPVLGRIPGIRRPRPVVRFAYLVAQAVIPGFLSFLYILSTRPLYPAFAYSASAIGLRPLNDQQVAGFLSKLSMLLVLLSVGAVVLARAPDSDDEFGPEEPLVWADVERQFERADRRAGRGGDPVPPSEPPAVDRPDHPAPPARGDSERERPDSGPTAT